ncbi:MAG: DNA primase [Solirubrobacteraceae bacterium]
MALYTRESRERVREAVDFVELVSARTELRRGGPSRYEGLCPFHDERTPSFGIDPVQKVYHCFGCQASGDVFTFVQETEGVDFKGALELLAQRAGLELELEREDPGDAERRKARERLLSLLSRTAAYYERVLWESDEAARAREYLAGRGLSEQALRAYGVGFAPSRWDTVLLASLRAGYSESELLAAGLAQRSRERGALYDRFRSRIMFPLADMRGRVLGFGARGLDDGSGGLGDGSGGLGDGADARRRRPKYLNTSETELFQKGQHLYGAHIARGPAARAGRVVLCEGYTDVIALHQAGIEGVVGSMGTALTERQLGELARIAGTVLLALDPDGAGEEAMLRVARLAAGRRLQLRAVALPAGLDPAELVQREGPEAISAAIERSVPFVRFQVELALERGESDTPEGRDGILDELRPILHTVPPSALRLDLERLVASRLALPERLMQGLLDGGERASTAVRRTVAEPRPSQARSQRRSGGRRVRGFDARRREVEQAFLSLCVSAPELGADALAAVDPAESFSDPLLRDIAQRLRAGDLREPLAGVDDAPPEARRALAEIVVEAGRGRASEAMLRVSTLQLQLGHIDRLIQTARTGDGGTAVSELALRRAALKRDFDDAQELALHDGG